MDIPNNSLNMEEILLFTFIPSQESKKIEFNNDHSLHQFFYEQKKNNNMSILKGVKFYGSPISPYSEEIQESISNLVYLDYIEYRDDLCRMCTTERGENFCYEKFDNLTNLQQLELSELSNNFYRKFQNSQ